MLAAITSTHTGVLKMREVRWNPPGCQVWRLVLVDGRVHGGRANLMGSWGRVLGWGTCAYVWWRVAPWIHLRARRVVVIWIGVIGGGLTA